MGLTQIVFWILTAIAVGSALMVITRKNPVHSVLYLVVTFFAISGHYILLNAQFLAIVNIIVYAGAIMVLFLFVVMLMNLNVAVEPQKNKLLQFAGVISGGGVFLVLIAALSKTSANVQMQVGDYGLIKNLGHLLFTDYVVPFEISSVLFLSAMIGAVVISKREH
ncbi:NADH-quinone oxidoreductase subunit J family protein [Ferruginibacter sp.]